MVGSCVPATHTTQHQRRTCTLDQQHPPFRCLTTANPHLAQCEHRKQWASLQTEGQNQRCPAAWPCKRGLKVIGTGGVQMWAKCLFKAGLADSLGLRDVHAIN